MKLALFLLTFGFLSNNALGITLEAWKNMKPEEKIEYMNSTYSAEVQINQKQIMSNPGKIESKTLNRYMELLANYEAGFDIDVEDDYYATVGAHKITATLLFSDEQEFLATTIYYIQTGCSHFDQNGEYIDQGGHYATLSEAESNGCTDNDVSWAGFSMLDENLQELTNSDYMQWSGH
jgi:hypothetical protein